MKRKRCVTPDAEVDASRFAPRRRQRYVTPDTEARYREVKVHFDTPAEHVRGRYTLTSRSSTEWDPDAWDAHGREVNESHRWVGARRDAQWAIMEPVRDQFEAEVLRDLGLDLAAFRRTTQLMWDETKKPKWQLPEDMKTRYYLRRAFYPDRNYEGWKKFFTPEELQALMKSHYWKVLFPDEARFRALYT